MTLVTRGALKGYTYQHFIYGLLLSKMDVDREIGCIEVEKNLSHNFDDCYLESKSKKYYFQVKNEKNRNKEMISKGYVLTDSEEIDGVTVDGLVFGGSVKDDYINFPNGMRYATQEYIKMYKPKKLSDGIGINKDSLSKIINGYSEKGKYYPGLIDEGILKKTFVEGKVGYSLVNNYGALNKILIEFSNPSFSKLFIRELRKDLMNSDYAKKLINIDLVKMKGYELNEEELNFMLIILKISASALLEYLNELDKTIAYNKNPYSGEFPKGYDPLSTPDELKMRGLMDLQFQAYNDISQFIPKSTEITSELSYPVEVEFEIKTTLKTKKGKFMYVNKLKKTSHILEGRSKIDTTNGLNVLKYMLFPDLNIECAEKLDKRFSFENSPLVYEEKTS